MAKGTAVAVAAKPSTAVAFKYDASKFDAARMAARANQFAKAMGGSELGTGGNGVRFPGTKVTFSKGVWSLGSKKADKVSLKVDGDDGLYVVEYHQMSAVWCKWTEGDDGKRRPTFHGLTALIDGDDFPERATLGDTDEDDWEIGMNGQPNDPWKCLLVIPVRRPDGEVIDHIELSTKTANRAGFYLFRDLAQEMALHVGELPVVRLGASVVEIDIPAKDSKGNPRIDKKTGKPITAKMPLDKPIFEIVAWTPMKDCDNPDNHQAEASDDVGEIEQVSRGAAKEEAKAVPPKGKRKVVAAEDDGDSI